MCNAQYTLKKLSERKITVMKKCLVVFYTLLCLMVFPVLVLATTVQDQPVRLINFNDHLLSASNSEQIESINQDDESFEFFAGPVSEADDLSVDSAYKVAMPLNPAKAKMKVMTCHITSSATNTMKTIFHWVSTGERVAHIAYFEVLNKSDVVKFRVKLQGPEFPEPIVIDTLTFGPQEPLYQWGVGYWRTYTVPGLYKIKMTAIPQTNPKSGRSSVECSFRVSAPADY